MAEVIEVEDHSAQLAKFNEMYISNTLKTWSDVDIVQANPPSFDNDSW